MRHISYALLDAFAILEESTLKAQGIDTSTQSMPLMQWNPDSQAKFLFPFSGFAAGEIVEFVKKFDDKLSMVRDVEGKEFPVPHQFIQVSIKIREVATTVKVTTDEIL